MLSQKRLETLQSKRAFLAKKIDKEERSASIDTTMLRHLKKQKLELKEIIVGIREDSATH